MNTQSRSCMAVAWLLAAAPCATHAAVPAASPRALPDASTPADGNTPLHLAALRGDADAVDALLARGDDPNALNGAGAAPLHYAAGSERMVNALLARGAKPDLASNLGKTPLMVAVSHGDSFAVAQRLIAAGADANARHAKPVSRIVPSGPLAIAIEAGDSRTIALLLEHKADVNAKGLPPPTLDGSLNAETIAAARRAFAANGVPPLTAAARAGDIETARLLLERGADINALAGAEATALNLAFFNGHFAFARFLIEQGADPHIKTLRGYGTTAMIWSAYNDAGDASIARLLVGRGVDVNATNDLGETALSYALKNGPDSEIIRYLRKAGAKPPAAPLRAKIIPAREIPEATEARSVMVRVVAQRAIDLLQRSSTAFLEIGRVRDISKCTSCHQQSLPAVAFGMARDRGLRIDEHEVGRQLAALARERVRRVDWALEIDPPVPANALTLGYDMDGLHAMRYAPDRMTAAMSQYVLGTQRHDGSWLPFSRRPPIQDGPIGTTAWAVRALQLYPPFASERAVADALRRTRTWLAAQPAKVQNERVFQLLGLAWAGEAPARLRPFADALIKEQRADGGWAQLPGLDSDAWATGSALVALHKAGIATKHPAYQRGLDYLLRTQFDDGSWWVRSRAWPFQPHFDGKFPHGKDQWISAAGTAWAVIALLNTIEPGVNPAGLPTGQELIAAFEKSSRSPKSEIATQSRGPAAAVVAVDFTRDIKPILERSCVSCHSGQRPKGSFNIATRESLLKGGQSGEPAVVPGHARESQLVRYVTGEIEDLEMPPLNRRTKYPELSAEEIQRLRAWIDVGAPWDSNQPLKTARVAPLGRDERQALGN